MKIIKIGVVGCLGRMGQELVKEITNNNYLKLCGGLEHPKHNKINKKLSDILSVKTNHKVSSDSKKIFSQSDVLIDFTTPKTTFKNISLAVDYNTNLVIGTTGLDDKILNLINKSSKKIAILQSNNMSLGVNLLFELVRNSSSMLKSIDYDIEISETHHRYKKDSPSGTAISLGKIAAEARNISFSKNKILNRTEKNNNRKSGEIGFAVTRGGEIAGEHTVSFIGDNDRIDITHKANNRSIFVKGAIAAAVFLSKQKKGLYSMKDVIGY